ncbi:ATP-binding protein [Streptomyces sp. NPDC013161]|uniref:ATP-binding protein n=1 Tax=Streptomyces sp. NPDC013161 TaxID=3364862 RepID=UPI00369FB496
MTGYPSGRSRSRTEASDVVWRELQPVPSHGQAPAPRTVSRPLPHRGYLSQVWRLDGRSERTPHEARALVTGTCHTWRVPHGIVDDVAVIVSELVTNAVTHAPGDTVTVTVFLHARDADESEVRVVVIDHGPRRRVQARHADADDEHGRGLFLVEALASRYEVQPTGDGTAVSACVHVPALRPLPPEGATHSPHEPAEDDDTDAPRSHS